MNINDKIKIFEKLDALKNYFNNVRLNSDSNFSIISDDCCTGMTRRVLHCIWKPENQRFNTISLHIYCFYANNFDQELPRLSKEQLLSLKKTLTVITTRWIHVNKNVIPKKFCEEIKRIDGLLLDKEIRDPLRKS